jgi:hypothetical protein
VRVRLFGCLRRFGLFAYGVGLSLVFCQADCFACGALVLVVTLAALASPCFLIGLVRFGFGCLPTVLAFPCIVIGLLFHF